MKSHVRAAVAASALAHATGKSVGNLYCTEESRNITIQAKATGNSIQGYDYEESCHFGGSLPSLYHYGVSAHYQMQKNGTSGYTGYDYDTSNHFTVNVNGRVAVVYDYENSTHYHYTS